MRLNSVTRMAVLQARLNSVTRVTIWHHAAKYCHKGNRLALLGLILSQGWLFGIRRLKSVTRVAVWQARLNSFTRVTIWHHAAKFCHKGDRLAL